MSAIPCLRSKYPALDVQQTTFSIFFDSPMGEGMIDWDLFFKMVKELNIYAPITIHVEYPLLEKEDMKLPLSQQQEIIVRKLKKDSDFINSYLKKYQLI